MLTIAKRRTRSGEAYASGRLEGGPPSCGGGTVERASRILGVQRVRDLPRGPLRARPLTPLTAGPSAGDGGRRSSRRHRRAEAGPGSTKTFRKHLGWNWLLKSGEVNDETGVHVHGVEGRPKQAGVGDDILATKPEGGQPAVLLAHADWPKVPRNHASAFSYCALGHLHWLKLGPLAPGVRTVAGYPGHLFSYWDGCGKAWPVHAITGEIRDGRVHVNPMPLSFAAGAPETRRMYVDASDAGNNRGTLVFENPPDVGFFDELGVRAQFEDQLDPAFGNLYRRIARIRYTSTAHLERILRSALEGHPTDVFVTPATGRSADDRVKDWGRALTGDRFEELFEKTFKRSEKTA